MPRVELVEAALRRGQQAILVSRLRRRHLLPVAELLDRCGFAALDIFGGATFEACIRFLGEDPFDRLRAIRAAAPNTPLLGVVSGQALVGHRHVADDVVDAFIAEAAAAGINIFRCFDPLNDTRNLQRCLRAAHAAGASAEASIVYTESPVHTVAGFIAVGEELAALGYDSLNVHDPAGLLGAGNAAELVRGLVRATGLPVGVHSAPLSGQAGMAYLAAAQAGAARLDVALTPLAGGASLPATEGVIAAMRGTEHSFDHIDTDALGKASVLLDHELTAYRDIIDVQASRLDPSVLRTQLRPQTVAHLVAELHQRNMVDHLEEAVVELQRVRAELGYPPLITPHAEIVATQAVYNVCDGDRYATISQEVKDYCLGLYGATPGPVDPDVRRAVNGRDEPITCRPADLLEPQMPITRREMEREGLETSSDAVVATYALFGAEYGALLAGVADTERLGDEPETEPAASPGGSTSAGDGLPAPAPAAAVAPAAGPPPAPALDVRELTVEVDGESYEVRVSGPPGTFGSGAGGAAPVAASAARPAVNEGTVFAPMQGLILKVHVLPGQVVQMGDVVAVLEAMKMQNDITASRGGVVTGVFVTEGSVVSPKDAICQVG